MKIQDVLAKDIAGDAVLTEDELRLLMSCTQADELEAIYRKAYEVKAAHVGRISYYRGLIEFSNYCTKDCLYCGIRKSNAKAERFSMSDEDILHMARWAYEHEYGSLTLQSGERKDEAFIERVLYLIKEIKKIGNGALGVTVCVGEQSDETYRRMREVGASRYLLRIESSNKELYEKIHPRDDNHSFETRLACLAGVRKAGLQVGTGVMIGIPGQTEEDLVQDILFFKKQDVDMIGMGPYVVHNDTPLGQFTLQHGLDSEAHKKQRVQWGLKMVALTRLFLKNVNIAATTALEALDPEGREKALRAGANILMPVITVSAHRAKYQLYNNKPCVDEDKVHYQELLTQRVEAVGDRVGWNATGDSPHFYQRMEKKQ